MVHQHCRHHAHHQLRHSDTTTLRINVIKKNITTHKINKMKNKLSILNNIKNSNDK